MRRSSRPLLPRSPAPLPDTPMDRIDSGYQFVPAEEERPEDTEFEHVPRPRAASTSGSSTVMVMACMVCTLMNVAAAILFLSRHSQLSSPPSPLPRPNQFIGLKLTHPQPDSVSPLPSLVNHPLFLAQVDSSQPRHNVPYLTRVYDSSAGTIVMDDQFFTVNDTRITIAQFRMRDFGMEACQLVLALPDLHDPERSRNQELRGNLSETIVFWRLSARSLLAPSGLSHSSVPPRAELLKHVYANRSMQTERFSCPQDSLQTFEVSSISAYPGLQFWQDRRSPAFGLHVVQHSTSSADLEMQ